MMAYLLLEESHLKNLGHIHHHRLKIDRLNLDELKACCWKIVTVPQFEEKN
jgi:hypothetical protein